MTDKDVMHIYRRGLIAGLLLVTGCASPIQTYFDYEKPAMPAYISDYQPAYLGQINHYTAEPARKFMGAPRLPQQYEIVPGQTDLLVVYARNDTFSKIDSNAKAIRFTAEPGHTYRVEPLIGVAMGFRTLADNEWDVRVVETVTGTVMAETHDRPKAESQPSSHEHDSR